MTSMNRRPECHSSNVLDSISPEILTGPQEWGEPSPPVMILCLSIIWQIVTQSQNLKVIYLFLHLSVMDQIHSYLAVINQNQQIISACCRLVQHFLNKSGRGIVIWLLLCEVLGIPTSFRKGYRVICVSSVLIETFHGFNCQSFSLFH